MTILVVAVVGAVATAGVISAVAIMTAETRHIAKWIANFEKKVISYFCWSYSF